MKIKLKVFLLIDNLLVLSLCLFNGNLKEILWLYYVITISFSISIIFLVLSLIFPISKKK